MWSPRKGHAVVELNGRLILMGGRAREHTNLPHENMVGGVLNTITKEDSFFPPWIEVYLKPQYIANVCSRAPPFRSSHLSPLNQIRVY